MNLSRNKAADSGRVSTCRAVAAAVPTSNPRLVGQRMTFVSITADRKSGRPDGGSASPEPEMPWLPTSLAEEQPIGQPAEFSEPDHFPVWNENMPDSPGMAVQDDTTQPASHCGVGAAGSLEAASSSSWPSQQHIMSIKMYHPPYAIRSDVPARSGRHAGPGIMSSKLPLCGEEEEMVDKYRRDMKAHSDANTDMNLVRTSFSLPGQGELPCVHASGENWTDRLATQVREAAREVAEQPSNFMLWGYIIDHCKSQEATDALLRLMNRKDFNSRLVTWGCFSQMRASILKHMPEMTRCNSWHVEVIGRGGKLVPLYYLDGSPVEFFYYNAWQKTLEMYSDTSKRGRSTLRPCPQYSQDGTRRFNVPFSGQDAPLCPTMTRIWWRAGYIC